MDICLGNEPALMPVAAGQSARCYLHGNEADPERLADASQLAPEGRHA
jgi:hypothetical protein